MGDQDLELELEVVPLRGARVMFLVASPGRAVPVAARSQESHKYQYRISRVSGRGADRAL